MKWRHCTSRIIYGKGIITTMRKHFWLIIGLSWLLAACGSRFFAPPTPTPLPPTPTFTVTPQPSPTTTPSPTPTLQLPDIDAFSIRTHPDGNLYTGDHISLEIIVPDSAIIGGQYSLQVADESGEILGEADFTSFGIGGRQQATLFWVWDTAGLEAGAHEISLTLLPDGLTWTKTITLLPEEELARTDQFALWAYEESDCCLLYYITDTAAQRDIAALLTSADHQAADVMNQFDIEFDEPIIVTLMSRVIGHGGFAGSEIYISYLDRNYAGNDFDIVLHHEMVHILDAHLGGNLRPSILVEGVAVYLSGGHFKPEPLMPRAAALLDLVNDENGGSWYLPLAPLADDFYASQHEIGYLEAGALVEFMVNAWGWDAFNKFYRQIEPGHGGQAAAIDRALQTHFGITLDTLETQFIAALNTLSPTPELRDDVRLTVDFYDTVRRYQQMLDPSAYFLSAWLPDGPQMRQYGITADLARRPNSIENITLETLLATADEQLQASQYSRGAEIVQAVNAVLTALEMGATQPFDAHPVAAAYYAAVHWLTEIEYQVQRIYIEENGIRAEVSALGNYLMVLELGWDGENVYLQQSQ